MATLDFDAFDVLTFDCHGTLIDWERGILDALQPVLAPHGVQTTEDELLERYASHESPLDQPRNPGHLGAPTLPRPNPCWSVQ